MSTALGARPQAKASCIAIWTRAHRHISSSRPCASKYVRSDFASQPFTGSYEPGQPTNGPLGEIPLIGRIGPTPKMLKQHLDSFVVGQDRAKKVMSTSVFNHYQRILELRRREDEEQQLLQQRLRRERRKPHPVEGKSDTCLKMSELTDTDEFPGHQEAIPMQPPSEGPEATYLHDSSPLTIEKSNIMLLGPSGVGKTLMAKTLARVLEVPFSMSDCTPFTQAGYIGEDVQVCVERLLAAADYDVEAAEYGIIVLDEIDKIAAQKTTQGRDVGGEGVQQALLKIIEGTTLHIQAKPGQGSGTSGTRTSASPDQSAAGSNMFGAKFPSAASGASMGGQGPPSKSETYSVRTDNILFIFTGAFIGLHRKVLDRISKGSIGFGSPIKASSSLGTDASDTLLSVKPGSEESRLFEKHLPFFTAKNEGGEVKYNPLDLVEPSDLQAFGMIPELVGRIPVTTALWALDEDALIRVLTEPRNSLIRQYEQLFQLSGIELRFTSGALREIARTAMTMNTGARALRTCVERLLSEAMFEAPGSSIRHILVTEQVAKREQAPIYLARGQQHKFQSLIASEEEAHAAGMHSKRQKESEESETGVNSFEEYRARSTASGFV